MDIGQNIKGLIFDFDGTLFDLVIDWEALSQKMQQSFGMDSLAELDDVAPDKRQQVIDVIGAAEQEGVQNGQPKPDALDVLRNLSQQYKVAIVSRNNRATILAGLKKIRFAQDILVLAREDVRFTKPHPEALQSALKQFELEPSQVLVIGDTYHDVNAAHAAGLRAVVVKNPKLTFVPEGADAYIDTLTDLQTLLKHGGAHDQI